MIKRGREKERERLSLTKTRNDRRNGVKEKKKGKKETES